MKEHGVEVLLVNGSGDLDKGLPVFGWIVLIEWEIEHKLSHVDDHLINGIDKDIGASLTRLQIHAVEACIEGHLGYVLIG